MRISDCNFFYKILISALSRYADAVSAAQENKSAIKELSDQLYHLTALLVCETDKSGSKSMRRHLLRKISWAPVDVFDENVIETVIGCWQWISSARRDCEVNIE